MKYYVRALYLANDGTIDKFKTNYIGEDDLWTIDRTKAKVFSRLAALARKPLLRLPSSHWYIEIVPIVEVSDDNQYEVWDNQLYYQTSYGSLRKSL